MKKLYLYIIKTFIPLLLGSFAVAWFIVVMQLLWRFVGDIVGKGVDAVVFIKLMFFAAMTVVPLGLILAVLIASLMTFGNLGERLELLAMRAAGIPLNRILKPLFYLSICIGIGLFVFQNDWMITSQVKFWQYYFSIKNKSPELAIPSGVFYKEIYGYSIYVERKDTKRKMMYDMMLYDYQKGFQNATVLLADSGKLYSAQGGKVLVLELYNGESYSNLRENPSYYNRSTELVPYMREQFTKKVVQIPFNTDLDMVDEGMLSSQFVGKNAWELKAYTDSLQIEIDSLARLNSNRILHRAGVTTRLLSSTEDTDNSNSGTIKSVKAMEAVPLGPAVATGAVIGATQAITDRLQMNSSNNPEITGSLTSVDSVFKSLSRAERANLSSDKMLKNMGMQEKRNMYRNAQSTIGAYQNDIYFTAVSQKDLVELQYKNEFEFWRKFTYPVACVVFFLVGAPLGALIRKGGIGIPFVVAVLFFIIFYFLEMTGIKMSKEGVWQVWSGMWLPNLVLAPIGIGLIWLATNESNKITLESWMVFYRKAIGTITSRRPLEAVPISDRVHADYTEAKQMINELQTLTMELVNRGKRSYVRFFLEPFQTNERNRVNTLIDEIIKTLHKDKDILLTHRLGAYSDLRSVSQIYRPKHKVLRIGAMVLFPIGILFFLLYRMRERSYITELKRLLEVNNQVLEEVTRVERYINV